MLLISSIGSASAQFIRDNNTINESPASVKLKNLSSINALLVGYGFYCKIDEAKVKLLHDNFQTNIINRLSGENKNMALNNYEEKVKMAREKGPSWSSMTCENIYDEYSKILAIMQKEGANSIKPQILQKEK